ncbi:MAG: hypothetical protein Kow0037_30760 [Calditrichia bacterium]
MNDKFRDIPPNINELELGHRIRITVDSPKFLQKIRHGQKLAISDRLGYLTVLCEVVDVYQGESCLELKVLGKVKLSRN